MEKESLYIGVDIGGTTIVAARFSEDELLEKNEVPTGAKRAADEIMDSISQAIQPLLNEDVAAIGIGMPGYMNTESGEILLINNIPAFRGFSVKKAVEKMFGLPVFQNNDANCFALGEAYFGAGKEFRNMVGITIGTGLGGGIIINRQIHSGLYGGAGEVGCLPIHDGIGDDYCGNALFVNKYGKEGIQIYNEAKAGNSDSVKAFNELGTNIGELIRITMYLLAPEAFIFGGSVANAWEFLERPIQEAVNKFPVELIRREVKLLPAQLDNGGLYGAAALCISQIKS